VPVVADGDRFVFGQSLEAVAAFLRLGPTGHAALAPDVLVARWITVLRAAQRYVQQIPIERLNRRAVDTRDRTVGVLSHHVFRIAEAFVECAQGGVDYGAGLADIEPAAGTCTTGGEIAQYGESVIARLHQWWAMLPDKSARQTVQTFYGTQSVHELLERSTWHAAQHVRQLASVLERDGIDPEGPLIAEDLAGLPLPEGLY
jgi:hypothetical protein